MESSESTHARRTTTSESSKAGDHPADDKAVVDEKERTDKEIAERVAATPEPPTPTQAEADSFKTGEHQTRDVKPGASSSGYTTR